GPPRTPDSPRSGCGRAPSAPPRSVGTGTTAPSRWSGSSAADLRGLLAVVHEGAGLEEGQRLHDALLDAPRGSPAERAEPRRVQEDAGRVAHPAALATGVDDPRLHPEGPGDHRDALVDLDPVVVSEVEEVDGLSRAREGQEHAAHAVAHVEVALLLPTIAEDVEARGVTAQLPPEVDDVPVRVAGPEQRHEPEDPRPEAVAQGIGGEQPFGGELRGP